MKKRNPKLLAALIGAAMSMSHAAPVLASTTTAQQFTQDVIQHLSTGDLHGALALLIRLRDYNIEWLEIDGVRYEVEALIDQLRGSSPRPASIIGKLTGVHAVFVPCDGPWISKANIGAPPSPPADLFPTGSHGVC